MALGSRKFDLTLGVVLVLALLAVALGPALRIVYSERQLAGALVAVNAAGAFASKSDIALRREVQKLGRDYGFALSTADVVVRTSEPLTVGVEAPTELGYTLVLRLPILWAFDVHVLAMRNVKVVDNRR